MRHAPQERIVRREIAQDVVNAARSFEGALAVRVEDKRQGPPKLHDLPSLQKLCGSRFGWPASKTLEVAQELYDGQGKKIITGERLQEAKGIGTPATRAEIIGGLKKQGFLIAQGKHIVPTEAGLSLFGVLKQADPALVDPGLTAQLECLLDDVVVGKQEMVGAIDAVCNVAERIICKLKGGGAAAGLPCLALQSATAPKRFRRRPR